MAKTIRVIFQARGGFVNRQASAEEREQHAQALRTMSEKWRGDPGIRFICYFLRPGVGHNIMFEVDDVGKVDEMDHDIWSSRALLMVDYSLEIVLGNPDGDKFWGP